MFGWGKRKGGLTGSNRQVTAAHLQHTFDRRNFVIGGIQGGIGVLLAVRMGYIAVAENERYRMLSESNRVNLSLIPPRRGWILDRNGAPLASNRADFRIDIIPERVQDVDYTLAQLADLVDLGEVEVRDIKEEMERTSGYAAVEVASGLDYDTFAAVSVRLPELPGVVPQRGFSRYYPTGPAVGHLLGYVGIANREEYEKTGKDPLLVTPGYKIGKDGLEQQFEQTLRRGLLLNEGNFAAFFVDGPVASILFLCALLAIAGPLLAPLLRGLRPVGKAR